MGRDQRCIQQAMAFDANIRAVQEAICAIPALPKRDTSKSINAKTGF